MSEYPWADIHEWACVDDTCEIGNRAKIWQFATVIRCAKIGHNTVVSPGACIDGSHIGNDSKIGHNVAMGPGFRIGNGCFIGPCCVLFNDAWPRAHHVGFDYEGLRHGKIICVTMEDGSSLGAGAKVMPGITIGKNAMVAANAVVKKNVPANHLYTADDQFREFTKEPQRMRSV